MNDRNQIFWLKLIPKPKLFRFGSGLVIHTKTQTIDLPIFEHFVGEMDFKKGGKFKFCLVLHIFIYRVAQSNHYKPMY